jgi:hypothetical protein
MPRERLEGYGCGVVNYGVEQDAARCPLMANVWRF